MSAVQKVAEGYQRAPIVVGEREVSPIDVDDGGAADIQKDPDEPLMTEGRDLEIDVVGEREVSPIDVDDGIAAASHKEFDEPLMIEGRDIEIDDV